jgi:hypothetical protein
MDTARFKKAIAYLDKIKTGEIKLNEMEEETLIDFITEFNLLDPRTFGLTAGAMLSRNPRQYQ